MNVLSELDPFDIRLAQRAGGLLRAFNEAGVLIAADVHVALALGKLTETNDEAALLAAALAVRCPRLGHVCVDLTTVRDTVSTDVGTEVDLGALPWPVHDDWFDRLRASSLVGDDRPLKLEGTTLYLDRYWAAECQVAADLLDRADRPVTDVNTEVLGTGLDALFRGGQNPDLQRQAAASSVLRRLSVIAGGPGTGKTTTVARLLVLLDQQASAADERSPLVALAAPTGKAAVRLEEAVKEEAGRLFGRHLISKAEQERLLEVKGVTLHRLLGWSPNHTRFRHHRLNRLAHDVVVVDESSMVSLSLMARLVEAVRPDGRLVLVGDPDQLSSVEAGAVFGDLVGPVRDRMFMRAAARQALQEVVDQVVTADEPPEGTAIGDGIVLLRDVHRFGPAIAKLAEAVQRGDADTAIGLLSDSQTDVHWLQLDLSQTAELPDELRNTAVIAGKRMFEAATQGHSSESLKALSSFRVLCAHRRGPVGAINWSDTVERLLRTEIEGFGAEGAWYVGRPLLVTTNDYSLRLYNGDAGVVVRGADGRLVAVFEQGSGEVKVSPSRLAAVDTVFAMTVHKAQGSQFDTVAVLLPGPDSTILSRELLYTAITRGRKQVIVVSTEDSVRAAVDRAIARASGLRDRLWGA